MSDPRARTSWFGAMVASAGQTASLLVRNRMLHLFVLGGLALAVLAFAVSGRAPEKVDNRSLYCLLAWWMLGTVFVPWSSLYLAVQAVHGPIEDRTFQYVFVRPVSRAPLLLGAWLGVCALAVPLAAASGLALFAALAVRPAFWAEGVEWHLVLAFLPILAVGAVAHAAVGMLFATVFRRPLVMAALFVVGLQTITANLRVSAGLRRLTILDPLRRLVLDRVEPDARLAQDLWPAERDFRSELVGTPISDLTILVLVCTVLAVWRHARAEYDSRDRE